MERIQIAALGGADNFVVNDLSNTGVQQVAIDLSATAGSGVGDGAADSVTVDGTSAGNQITVVGSGGSVGVTGLSEQVTLTGTEGANDSLHINALGGNDTINAAALAAGQLTLTIDGGSGNDTILGSAGNDFLIGGDGNDFVDGNQGSDTALPRRRKRYVPVGSGRWQRHCRRPATAPIRCCSTAPTSARRSISRRMAAAPACSAMSAT